MLIDSLALSLEKSGALEGFWEKLSQGEDAVMGLASSARPFLVAVEYARNPRPTLVVVPGEEAADNFARLVGAYVGEKNVFRYHLSDKNFFNFENYPSPRETARRMEALWLLQNDEPIIVVASAQALVRLIPPAREGMARPLELKAGLELEDQSLLDVNDLETLVAKLVQMGYENTGKLAGPGSFSLKGGTLDIYAATMVHPIRLDFFGDELESIRSILPSTGQSYASLSEAVIYPVREYLATSQAIQRARKRLIPQSATTPLYRELIAELERPEKQIIPAVIPYLCEEMVGIGDYLSKKALTVCIEPRSLVDDAAHFYDDLFKRSGAQGLLIESMYSKPTDLDFGSNQRATYVSIMRMGVILDSELVVKRVAAAGDSDKLFGRIQSLVQGGYAVVFSLPNYRLREEIKLELVDLGIPIIERLESENDDSKAIRRGVVTVVDLDIPLGMIFPAAKLALVSLADTQGSMSSRPARHIDVVEITFPYKPGDYVVHAAHGIGFFKELVRREIDSVERDYILIEYAEGDKLYVPVEQFDRVTRYVGPEGSSPRLTRLNTSDWSRAMARARKATKQLAFDLVDVYARRASTKGYQYGQDTLWQKEMEESFPYQETPDQLAAIADIKADMQSIHPMDRLICGDVGFGKTEVALRAAFKATQDDKQVMVLCPTTILVQQHYTTFQERFEPFGIRVEALSRFRTPAQQKKILEDFSQGKVQVLIGTHRLLSRDVNPLDLGLVIIDEEQRFGVGHKEQFKNMRSSIDVLTLSATPIPRTMQMGLSGVRDMSLIMTPPDDRRAVKVTVGEWDPDLISDAITRELNRGGQVYYVSNRVRSIDDAVRRVKDAAGQARIGVAHGQMSKEELEGVMEDFSAGEIDVLVATTIIESGIDNPHTNTLIIEDSQRLGLAQMYQLKGRVGRSSTQAYAYFLFPDNITLTQEAQARLTALNENTELGSGMRIAMQDLEIRGAGSILGAEQSGNMSAVGFDLFAQMLSQAVALTREGNTQANDYLPPALSDIVVNTPDHTYIPEAYVPDTDERVMYYRKLASAQSLEYVDDLEKQLLSAHPEMPQATINQFDKTRLKVFAYEKGISTISVSSGKLSVEPITLSKSQASSIRRLSGRYLADRKKMIVPMRALGVSEDGSTVSAVFAFLKKLLDSDSAEARS